MPRQPRLDAPDTLHHIMGQGIDRIMKQPAEKGWLNEEVIGTSPAGMTAVANQQKRESKSIYLKQAIQWESSLKDCGLETKSGF